MIILHPEKCKSSNQIWQPLAEPSFSNEVCALCIVDGDPNQGTEICALWF